MMPTHPLARHAPILFAIVLTGLVYAATIRQGHDWGGDFSVYIAHARNIATGQPYRQSSYLPNADSIVHMPASYPPVFPLLLAPLYAWRGLDYFAFKLVVQVMLLLSMWVYYAIATLRGVAPWLAAAAVAAFGLSGLTLSIKDQVLSDPTYLFLAGVALACTVRIYGRRLDETRPILSGLAIAALFLLACACRSIGLSLPAAFVVYDLFRTRRIRLFSVLTAGTFVAGFAIYSALLYDSRSYGNQFGFNLHTYFENALTYARTPAALWGGSPRVVRWVLGIATLLLACAGWVRRAVKDPSIIEVYVLTTLGPVILYSSGASDRYLLPLCPLLLLYAVDALGVGRPRWVTALGIAVLAFGSSLNVIATPRGPIEEGVLKPGFVSLCEFINRDVQPGSVLVSWNPRVLALYTNRPSEWYPKTDNDAAFERYLTETHAAYIAVYPSQEDDRRWLLPHVQQDRERYRMVYNNPDFSVYRVLF